MSLPSDDPQPRINNNLNAWFEAEHRRKFLVSSVRIEAAVATKLRTLAIQQNTTVSGVLRVLIERGLAAVDAAKPCEIASPLPLESTHE